MQSPDTLEIKQTATGYWAVLRDSHQVASAMTRKGAEAERELLLRLRRRSMRRANTPRPHRP